MHIHFARPQASSFAKAIKKSLAASGVDITHAQAMTAVAAALGFKETRAMAAALPEKTFVPNPVPFGIITFFIDEQDPYAVWTHGHVDTEAFLKAARAEPSAEPWFDVEWGGWGVGMPGMEDLDASDIEALLEERVLLTWMKPLPFAADEPIPFVLCGEHDEGAFPVTALPYED